MSIHWLSKLSWVESTCDNISLFNSIRAASLRIRVTADNIRVLAVHIEYTDIS